MLIARWLFLALFGRLVDRGWELYSDLTSELETYVGCSEAYDCADREQAEIAGLSLLPRETLYEVEYFTVPMRSRIVTRRDVLSTRLYLFASHVGWA